MQELAFLPGFEGMIKQDVGVDPGSGHGLRHKLVHMHGRECSMESMKEKQEVWIQASRPRAA